MAGIKVLIEGYAKEIEGGLVASSTVTLVQEKGSNIIVDPGINRELLLKKLSEEGLESESINYVLLTHTHLDHCYLAGIFPEAKALDDEFLYGQDRECEHGGTIPGTNLKIISTPGHDPFHCSLVVRTEKGTTVIAGDVFWWKDDEEQDASSIEALMSHRDPFVKDEKALEESRRKILEIADFVIPGHGKLFKNPMR